MTLMLPLMLWMIVHLNGQDFADVRISKKLKKYDYFPDLEKQGY